MRHSHYLDSQPPMKQWCRKCDDVQEVYRSVTIFNLWFRSVLRCSRCNAVLAYDKRQKGPLNGKGH